MSICDFELLARIFNKKFVAVINSCKNMNISNCFGWEIKIEFV